MKKELKFEYLPVELIDISPFNVRKVDIEEGLDELARSIREIGLQQPIVVLDKKDGRYELVIGQRRFLAFKRLGWPKIPAIISSVTGQTDAIVLSFSENIQRRELAYRDKMMVASELLNRLGSIGNVAKSLGVTIQTVRNYLGYSAVPEAIKIMVEQKRLAATTATQIARSIQDEDKAIKIAEKIEELPRSKDRRIILDIARQNPTKSADQIIDDAKKSRTRRISIDLTQRLSEALQRACEQYKSDEQDILSEALSEWLDKRGFIQ